MRPIAAIRLGFAAAVALAAVLPSAARASCANAPLTIEAPALAGGDIRSLETRFRDALGRACGWWGDSFDGPFRLVVEDSRGPSMALVPAWRGERGTLLFRARPVRAHEAALTHEIVHVLAPNANRFLAEGLAVWAHQALAGERAYPNFGDDLHALARPLAGSADLAALERIATPERLQLPGLDGRAAYLVAGSFVGFLIETRGMDAFRALYAMTPLVEKRRDAGAPSRWNAVYGADFAALADAWRGHIGAQPR